MNFEAAREYAAMKLGQARDAVDEAEGLLLDGAAVQFVLNNLFFGFYYPVLALLRQIEIQPGMQSVALALFEKEFVRSGRVDRRFHHAAQRIFELKPKCSGGERPAISAGEISNLLIEARNFIAVVSSITGT